MKKTKLIIFIALGIAALCVCLVIGFGRSDSKLNVTEYTATFQADGVVVQEVKFTLENKTINEPTVPRKIGYIGKWESYVIEAENITINAIYTAKKYKLTFDYDISGSDSEIKEKTVTFDSKIGELPTPTKDGCIFSGWVVDGKNITENTIWNIDNNVTAVASWKKISEGLKYILNEDKASYSVFKGECTDTDIVIPAIHYGKPVTFIGDSAFENCTDLTSVIIPDSVISIGISAFENCSSLKNIAIPDSVTEIGKRAFFCCYRLTNVTIPNNVTEIGSWTFYDCSSLISVTIPISVTSIANNAFVGCNLLEYNEYDNAYYLGNETNKYVALIKAKSRDILSCNINENCKVISACAFVYCSGSLTSVTIPDSVISIGDSAFENCSSLTSVTIPISVTSIGSSAFKLCSNLTRVTIPDSVIYIDNFAFNQCNSLTSINYKGTVNQWRNLDKGVWWDLYTGAYTIYCSDGTISK